MDNNTVGNTPTNAEQVSVKISHGNEIRRVTLPQTTYASLVENTAQLFGIPQASISIKYEDDDGDKISMSSDMEFNEALRLSKATQKILRLFVELKSTPVEQPAPVRKESEGIYLGPQGGRFGPPPHRPPHPFMHPHPHPHPPFHHGPPGFAPPHFGGEPAQAPAYTPAYPSAPPAYPSAQAPAYSSTSSSSYTSTSERGGYERGGYAQGGSYGPYYNRRHLSHSSHFGPQSSPGNYTTHSSTSGTWGPESGFPYDRRVHKESFRAMKDQWKQMKKEATTEEDKRKLKEMRSEWKNDMKQTRKEVIQNMKAMRMSEKGEKKQKFVARHVADITVPDGTELPPNTPFVKTWRIRNEGPAWPIGSQLLFVSHKGDNLNGPERVVIQGEVNSGQEVDVSVPLITPSEPGRYVGYYRMVTPDNKKFGQRVWVSFVVTQSANDVNNTNNSKTELSKTCDTLG